ncbi:MAG: 30S ribosomal protein S21 [Patescibacteria group bacterium]|jgi:ribosomal protein S21|nr:30S ribosomal protein S21 [Patescibacteria group bacterium]
MVEVKKKKGETFDALLRRFQRRMQQGGVALEARKHRFHDAGASRNKVREGALRREVKRQQYEYEFKTGKLKEEPRRPSR